jgi:general stress protein 26
MVTDPDNKIERAREFLATTHHAAMATVNEDGSPHNTPYFFMCSADLTHLYWGSHPESEHSKNVTRTGQLFVVLYGALERGGLYIRATDGRVAEGRELDEALAEHNRRRALQGKEPLPREYYQGESPQRMYIATTRQFWVSDAERDSNGLIIRDVRREVGREELIGGTRSE